MGLAGFGNHHQSEVIAGALPTGQNSPQQCKFGLYAEQLSGSAFTRPRHQNLHSWLYRILPSVVHNDFTPSGAMLTDFLIPESPNPMRWFPKPIKKKSHDFIDGLWHLAGNQNTQAFIYSCNVSMQKRYFSNRDGELLFVPYLGTIRLHTEFGNLEITPGSIAVIPRGVYFKVELLSASAAGYLCENSGSPFTLPQLGIIGANGLANPRHFIYPEASYEMIEGSVEIFCKYKNHLWKREGQHSPLNVVAWHGNYAPYTYDLSLFNTINTVSFDHPDPSIFTVLTSESQTPGTANLDFVIFPPRWMVAEHTFKPPYFHRNIMNELMGLITGTYDAKREGFEVGGVSLHNCMTAHGPDATSFKLASEAILKPEYYADTLAIMFETNEPWKVTQKAYKDSSRQTDYSNCWKDLPIRFESPMELFEDGD